MLQQRNRCKTVRPPAICPVCGVDLPVSARACPECGADYETGWNKSATHADGLDLPEDNFDYDDFIRREFGKSTRSGSGVRSWLWPLIALLVCIVLIVIWIF